MLKRILDWSAIAVLVGAALGSVGAVVWGVAQRRGWTEPLLVVAATLVLFLALMRIQRKGFLC